MRRNLLTIVVGIVLLASTAFARQRDYGYCEQGGAQVATGGALSTNLFQGAFPGCTVTVYLAGTNTLAVLFGDNNGNTSPQGNPFTAALTDGYWFFYADDGRYDVVLSGAGISAPFTRGDQLLHDSTQSTVATYRFIGLSFATSLSFDASVPTTFSLVLSGNVASSVAVNAVQGQFLQFLFCQDSTGGRTLAWPPNFLRPPPMPSAANACMDTQFVYDGTNWRVGAATGDSLSLSTNTINAPAGLFTLPAATDTLAGLAAAQTFTNKTLSTGTIHSTSVQWTEIGTPGTNPPASNLFLYAKTGDAFCMKNSAGVETCFGTGGGGGSGTVGSGTAGQMAFYSLSGTAIIGNPKLTDLSNVLTYSGTTLTLNTGTTTASTITSGDGFVMTIGGSAASSIITGTSAGSGKSLTIASHDGDATHFGADLILRAGSSTNPAGQSLSPGWVDITAANASGSAAGSIALVPGTDAIGAAGWVQIGCVGGSSAPCPSPQNPTTARLRMVGKTSGAIDITVADALTSIHTFQLPTADGSNGLPLVTNGSGVLSYAALGVLAGGTGATTFSTNGTLWYNGSVVSSTVGGVGTFCWVQTNGAAPTWGSCSASSGATTALNNLAGVAINATLVPAVGNIGLAAADLGTNAIPFNTIFLGSAATNNLQLKGTGMTAARNATFPDNSGTVAELNFANTWTAAQAFSAGFTVTTWTSTTANASGTGTGRLGPTDALRYGCVSCNSGLTTTGLTDMNLVRGNGSSGPALVGDYLGVNFAGPIGTFTAGGSLTIQPTSAASGNTGGDLTLSGGGTSGVGINGNLHLKAGTGGSGTAGFVDIGSSGFGVVIANDAAAGTVANNLVSMTGSGNAIQTSAGASSGVIGIAGANAGTTGSVTVIELGRVNCVFDGTATPGHYVGVSLSGVGLCSDVGLSPSITAQTVGTVIANVSGTTYSVLVSLGSAPGSATATNVITNPGSTQTIQATASTAVGLAVKQPSGGSVDIFQVFLSDSTKVFSINSVGQAVFGTGTSSVTSSAFISTSSNVAGQGLLRAASSDIGLCFKDNAAINDVCIAKNTSDVLTFSRTSGFAVTQAGSSFADTVSFTAPAAARTITFGDPGGNDSVAYLAAAQIFTNKAIGDDLDVTEITTPANPASGAQRIYAGTDHLFHCLTSAGANCLPTSGGGAAALSAITAAAGTNTINNGNFPQRWNFSLTTNSTIAMRFSENVASTATSSSLVQIDTIAASTLNPLTVTGLGTANGLRVNTLGDLTFLGTGILDTGTASAVGAECANEGVTGTTNGLVAKLNTSNQCIKATVSDLAGVEGIVIKGGAITGNAVIATGGVVLCTFSNATTVNDYVGVSAATAGDCLDLGVNPTAGVQVLGKVLTAGLAGTSQSVAVYGRGMLGVSGTTNQVNTAFAAGVLTLSLPQSISTASTVTFGAVKSGQLTTTGTGGALIVQIADTATATSVTGLLTVRGGDQTGTANGNAGNVLIRGGSSSSTGTGQAGNADIRAGQGTAAANGNGHVQVQGSYIKGVTYTVANLQCFSADNTVQDCATSATNFVAVAVASNGNAATVANYGTQITVNYDATVSPSAGWFACSSATVAGKVTAQAAACSAGRTVGVIEAGGTNVTSGSITYAHY